MILKNLSLFLLRMFRRRSFKELLLKNLEILVGYPIYALSFLTPRFHHKWLLGSHVGFSGNSKYFFIYLCEHHADDVKCIWIAKNKSEKASIEALGLPVCLQMSLRGFFHALTAHTYIFSYQTTDINFWTSGRVRRVNLWHGVGIKNIEFKTKLGSGKVICDEKNVLARIYLPYQFQRPHLFLSTSDLMTGHFMECFRIDEKRCMEYLYPRCEIFFWNKEKLIQFVNKYESVESKILINQLLHCDKAYLYMPTWRSKRNNFIEDNRFDYAKLNEVLKKKNQYFLLKLHPEEAFALRNISQYSNIIEVDKNIDIYPLLPFTSVLITDYSSIYYDYILMRGKDVLLYPFDYQEYITSDRDLAFDYDEYTPGKRVYTFNDLLQVIESGESLEYPERDWIIEQFWGKAICKNSSEAIYTYLCTSKKTGVK